LRWTLWAFANSVFIFVGIQGRVGIDSNPLIYRRMLHEFKTRSVTPRAFAADRVSRATIKVNNDHIRTLRAVRHGAHPRVVGAGFRNDEPTSRFDRTVVTGDVIHVSCPPIRMDFLRVFVLVAASFFKVNVCSAAGR